jgi:serine/threonine protein phosphatase PrpC
VKGLQQLGPHAPLPFLGATSPQQRPYYPCCSPPSHPTRLPPSHRRPSYCLFAAFDGHNGSEAARFAAHTIVPILEAFLPPREAPGAASAFPSHQGPGQLQGQLQAALVETLLELQRQFAMSGLMGGCTATLVLQVGALWASGLCGEPAGRSSRQ